MSETFLDHGITVNLSDSGEVDVTCPRCSPWRKKSSDRCLSVNIDEGTWLCHHCGWDGGLKKNNEIWNGPRFKATRDKLFVKPEYSTDIGITDDALEWFYNRGISPEVLAKEKITAKQGWVKFPYYRNGEVVNIKSRKIDDKRFYQEKDAEKILYGMKPILEMEGEIPPLIWVEGEMDRLSLLECGYKYVVSVPDGAPPPGSAAKAKFDYLSNCEEYIRQFPEHIIAVDSDAPGECLRDELGRRLGIEKCRRVTWPPGCNDANDVLTSLGQSDLEDAIAAARFFPVEGVFEVKDILTDAMRLYDEGVARGVDTGWVTVNKHLSIRPGELGVLTGIPASGKSSWLDALTMNIAVNEDWKIGVFSPENAPLSRHFKALAELYIGKPYLRGPSERMTPAEVVEAARFLHEHYYFISPQDNMLTIDDILDKAKAMVFRYGIQFLVIDPYNDIGHSTDKREENMSIRASIILSKTQRFARMHKCFVMLVAHPYKLKKDERTGEYPVPDPYSISDSAHFRNRADLCLAGHRPDLTKDVFELHVQKVRFKDVGSLGCIKLDYSRHNGRFFDHMPSIKRNSQARAMARKSINREFEEAQKAHKEYSGYDKGSDDERKTG